MKDKLKPFFVINRQRIKAESFPELLKIFSWKGVMMYTHPAMELKQKMQSKNVHDCIVPVDVYILINITINNSRFAKKTNGQRNIGENEVILSVEEVPLLKIITKPGDFLFKECADIYEKYKDAKSRHHQRDLEIYELIKTQVS